jgi:voltage-gated potassium channel
MLLVALWLLFSAGLYFAEQRAIEPVITSYAEALYWGIAAFSTAGIANMPSAQLSQLIGGAWIVVGSVIFFGIIIATITGYFMRALQRPAHRLVETIEYNLEHLQDLSVEELDLLKDTVDALILHMERVKQKDSDGGP